MPSVPRVLLLCNDTIQPFTGGGVTLRSLFSAFPRERLFSVHVDGHDADRDRVGADYRVSAADVRYLRPLGLVRAVARRIVRQGSGPPDAASASGDVAAVPLASGVRGLLDHACAIALPPNALDRIRDFAPDVIYGWIGDSLWAGTVVGLASALRRPYVVHFMDNHIGLPPGDTWTARVGARLYTGRVNRAVSRAAGVLAISDAMAAAYGARWSRRVDVFHGVMTATGWPTPAPKPVNSVFELAFTGSIEAGQLGGLLDVARALAPLNADGARIRLVLYLTPSYRSRVESHFANLPVVEIRSHPPTEGLRAALASADALLLAYAFDSRTVEYYRYSFATKLVPYMLSGTPILAYGPASIAPIDYVVKGGWARVVTTKSPDALATELRNLMGSASDRLRLARLAHEAACREHDERSVSLRFRDYLSAASRREQP